METAALHRILFVITQDVFSLHCQGVQVTPDEESNQWLTQIWQFTARGRNVETQAIVSQRPVIPRARVPFHHDALDIQRLEAGRGADGPGFREEGEERTSARLVALQHATPSGPLIDCP